MLPRTRVSRRRVLASLGTAPVASMLAPAAGAGEARPAEAHSPEAPKAEPVLTATLDVHLSTPANSTVGSAVIRGGTAAGELAGAVIPGSLSWTRDPVRGVLQLDSRFELQASGGLRIHVADRATVAAPTTGCWEAPFITTPELTVVDGSSADRREAVYVGRMDASQIESGRVRLTVHRVL